MVIRAMHVEQWRFGRFIFCQMHHIVSANIQPIAISSASHALAHRQPQNVAIKIAQFVHGFAISAEVNVVDFGEWHKINYWPNKPYPPKIQPDIKQIKDAYGGANCKHIEFTLDSSSSERCFQQTKSNKNLLASFL